jgi:hypothetical protein
MLRRTLYLVLAAGLAVGAFACEDDDDVLDVELEEFAALTLTGTAERPNQVNSNASGIATFTNNGDGTVDFQINVANITNATLAHIHGPANATQAAGVIVTLFNQPTIPVTVTNLAPLVVGRFPTAAFFIRAGVSLDSVLTLMRNGNAYVNVHTQANPGGEIRGQITVTN